MVAWAAPLSALIPVLEEAREAGETEDDAAGGAEEGPLALPPFLRPPALVLACRFDVSRRHVGRRHAGVGQERAGERLRELRGGVDKRATGAVGLSAPSFPAALHLKRQPGFIVHAFVP